MNRCTGPPSRIIVKNVYMALSKALNCFTLGAGEMHPKSDDWSAY